MDKMKMKTQNLTENNLERIKMFFPNCVTESKSKDGELKKAIDFGKLKQELSKDILEGDESYEFNWVGKKAAMVEANKPTTNTLRPNKEDSVNWDNTENLYIEGDNLEVLKLLQESYLGKVKMIYIDPPYNTGNDFVYRDDFKQSREDYEEDSGEVDEEGNRLFRNTDSNGRFHSDWCSMMYPRLKLARNLLSDDGVIFISIDDEEIDNLKKIAEEIFGENNYKCCFARVTKKGGKSSSEVAKNHDYLLMFTKNNNEADLIGVSHNDPGYNKKDEYFDERGFYKLNQTLDYDSLGYSSSLDYPIEIEGETFFPGGDEQEFKNRQKGIHSRADWAWRWSKELFDFAYKNGFIEVKYSGERPRIYTKTYQKVSLEKKQNGYYIGNINRTKPLSTLEFTENKYSNDNAKKNLELIMGSSFFEYTKPVALITKLLNLICSKNYIALDFFSGSATTAHAVMQLNAEDGGNRKYIMVQLPEKIDEKSEAYKAGYKNICEIGKERIRRAAKKIHEDNPEAKFDDGFRDFKLDSSNMKDVYYSSNDIDKDIIELTESNIKEDRTDLDLLFQCLLDWGLPISKQYKSEKIDGFNVHFYDEDALVACFDENISEDCIKEIAKRKPLRVVFRDSSFKDSSSKINVEEIFKMLSPKTTVKVI